MSAIPTSDLPGFKKLNERVINALDRCQESQDIDFKESTTWDNLKWRITKTVLAMGNLRDGGIIIVGASERGNTWDLNGITDKHLKSYNVDNIIDFVNKYSSPVLKLDIVIVTHRNNIQFLAIQVHEFKESPFVCKKNGEENLLEGAVYVRPSGVARTTRVTNAEQMIELLDLAAEIRARRILEISRRIGMVPSESHDKMFDDELEGL